MGRPPGGFDVPRGRTRLSQAPGGVTGFVDGPGLYPALTARGNLAALAALRGPGAPLTGIGDVLDQVGLTDVADDKVRGFSLGMRQRLGLAAALLARPRLLVLDEPSTALTRQASGTLTGSLPAALEQRSHLLSSEVLG